MLRRDRTGAATAARNPRSGLGEFAPNDHRRHMDLLYADRSEAGRVLARALAAYAGRKDVVVLALPRGGMPVGYEVARALGAPLDILIVRKLGLPGQMEVAMGALASGGVRVLNEDVLNAAYVSTNELEEATRRERKELERRERAYRGDRPLMNVRGKTVIVVDDGLATGSTMRAAVEALRQRGAARVVAAVPVGAPETCQLLGQIADEMICAATPEEFRAVGLWYQNFDQTTDEEVHSLLADAWSATDPAPPGDLGTRGREITLTSGEVVLNATLHVPARAIGLVLFAHGSGSSRFSPRNRFVANVFQGEGFATLLADLLTADEERIDEQTAEHRFDIGLLAERLVGIVDWAEENPDTGALRLGLFGASTGAAAALIAAAERPDRVAAVVSRGGRPDLAGDALRSVRTPTLCIVGGDDTPVIRLNRSALRLLAGPVKELVIVPGATHLFEEPGALEEVARLAAGWFRRHLTADVQEQPQAL